MTGAQPLAMHDAHAAHLTVERVDQELPQGLLGFGNRESVQIDLALEAVFAAAQPAHHGRLHARSLVHQLLAAGEGGIGGLGGETFLQHRGAVGAREACACAGLRPPRRMVAAAAGERLDTADGVTEQPGRLARIVRVVVTARLSHATSARRH